MNKGVGVMKNRMVSWLLVTALVMTAAVPMATVATDSAAAYSKKLPKKYDLRGKGLITPVKNQNPYGSCWAFGGIAAAESSILKAKKTTYRKSKLDLSEKHVAWFVYQRISKNEDKRQVGEGLIPLNKDESIYDVGGQTAYITTVFSSGSGPMPESYFPYMGKKGLTDYDVYKNNKDENIKKFKDGALEMYKVMKKEGETFPEFIKRIMGETVVDADDYAEKQYYKALHNLDDPYENGYSETDDWTIPRLNKDGDPNRNLYAGWTMKDGNVLPAFSVRSKNEKWKKVSKTGMKAVKRELMNGHAVSMSILSDNAQPGEKIKGKYINLKTWAHYTYKNGETNHSVCIVGWNDNYSRKNFNKGHRPPKNGAWIVKNSWGAETADAKQVSPSGKEINKGKWGIKDKSGKHTGYFYVSYYDKTIETPESMTFNFDFNKYNDFYCTQYDYMPAAAFIILKSKRKIKSANIFKGEAGSSLHSVSARTARMNTKVRFDVYKLHKNARKPTQGKKVRSFKRKYTYAGFHRVKLKKKLYIRKGEKYSVVVTQYYKKNGKKRYAVPVAAGIGKKTAKKHGAPAYFNAVVNKGESFICTKGKWTDWKVYKNKKSVKRKIKKENDLVPRMDNFAIKAYCVR